MGRPQTSVMAAVAPASPRQPPTTSSQRSSFQSGLASAVSAVNSAVAVEVAGLLVVRDERVGHVAVELIARRGEGGRRDERPPVPGPVRVPDDVPGLAEILALVVDPQAGPEELDAQAIGPAAVGQALLGRLGGEAADEAVDGRHGRRV